MKTKLWDTPKLTSETIFQKLNDKEVQIIQDDPKTNINPIDLQIGVNNGKKKGRVVKTQDFTPKNNNDLRDNQYK